MKKQQQAISLPSHIEISISRSLILKLKKDFPGAVVEFHYNPLIDFLPSNPYLGGDDPITLFDGEQFWWIPFETSQYKSEKVARRRASTLSELRGVPYHIISYFGPDLVQYFEGIHPKKLAHSLDVHPGAVIL